MKLEICVLGRDEHLQHKQPIYPDTKDVNIITVKKELLEDGKNLLPDDCMRMVNVYWN